MIKFSGVRSTPLSTGNRGILEDDKHPWVKLHNQIFTLRLNE